MFDTGFGMLEESLYGDLFSEPHGALERYGRVHYLLSRTSISYFTNESVLKHPVLQQLNGPCPPFPHEVSGVDLYHSVQEPLSRRHPFLTYAMSFWAQHAKNSESVGFLQNNLLDYFYWRTNNTRLESIMKLQEAFYKTIANRFPRGQQTPKDVDACICEGWLLPSCTRGSIRPDLIDVDRSYRRMTLAHLLAMCGFFDPIRLMITENPADALCSLTRRFECIGNTPILSAARNGWRHVVQWLCEHYVELLGNHVTNNNTNSSSDNLQRAFFQ
mgnify:CR=1 FL=1